MTHDQQTAAAALIAACEALNSEAGFNPNVRGVQMALDHFHATLPLADRPRWNALDGVAAAYVKALTGGVGG